MAVVINEMEVVSEPAPAAAPGGGAKGEEKSSASNVQRAQELERGLERHRQRMTRVRAH